MANGSLSSGSGGEGEIRQRIIEADLVDAIVALPPQLFHTTGIPACLWFLTRDKTGRNLRASDRARTGETLFIDARKLGTMQTRALRVLTGSDDGETLLADGLGDPNHDSRHRSDCLRLPQMAGRACTRVVGRGQARQVGLPR